MRALFPRSCKLLPWHAWEVHITYCNSSRWRKRNEDKGQMGNKRIIGLWAQVFGAYANTQLLHVFSHICITQKLSPFAKIHHDEQKMAEEKGQLKRERIHSIYKQVSKAYLEVIPHPLFHQCSVLKQATSGWSGWQGPCFYEHTLSWHKPKNTTIIIAIVRTSVVLYRHSTLVAPPVNMARGSESPLTSAQRGAEVATLTFLFIYCHNWRKNTTQLFVLLFIRLLLLYFTDVLLS